MDIWKDLPENSILNPDRRSTERGAACVSAMLAESTGFEIQRLVSGRKPYSAQKTPEPAQMA